MRPAPGAKAVARFYPVPIRIQSTNYGLIGGPLRKQLQCAKKKKKKKKKK